VKYWSKYGAIHSGPGRGLKWFALLAAGLKAEVLSGQNGLQDSGERSVPDSPQRID
jgi:hypothetical protein